jgi:hypothetical protein
MLDSRWVAGPFAFFLVLGLACTPKTRTYENTGGQGGEGAGGNTGGGGSMSSPSSSSGACVPSGAEDCFNGLDDDCNGMTDCEDAVCTDVAVCEPLPANAASGVIVLEADPCPAGFTADERIIHHGLQDGGCTGCGCTTGPTSCSGEVWYYKDAAACSGDVAQVGGTAAGSFGFTCDSNPITGGFVYGARASAWKVSQTCNANGAPTLAPPAWNQTRKFCRADAEGKGCGAGNTCVPKQTTAPHCALAEGSGLCNGFGMSQSDWYTGFTDTRVCGACGCTATGGGCKGVQLAVGSDYSCINKALVNESTKQCFPNGIYAPPVHLTGNPTLGSCTADGGVKGSLIPTEQLTLCCNP